MNSDDDTFADLDDQVYDQQPTAQQQQVTTEQPIMIPLDKAMAMFQAQPAAPAPIAAPQPMTPEQQAAHLRHFGADEEFANGFAASLMPDQEGKVNAKAAQQAINSIVQGVRAEYLRALELYDQRLEGNLKQRMEPIEGFVSEQRREAVWNQFSSTYPQLKQFRQFVDMAADTLATRFPPGTTQQQAFQYVAGYVQQQLEGMGIKVAAQGKQQQVPQQQAQYNFPGLQTAPAPMMSTMPAGLPARGGHQSSSQSSNGNSFYDPETFGR